MSRRGSRDEQSRQVDGRQQQDERDDAHQDEKRLREIVAEGVDAVRRRERADTPRRALRRAGLREPCAASGSMKAFQSTWTFGARLLDGRVRLQSGEHLQEVVRWLRVAARRSSSAAEEGRGRDGVPTRTLRNDAGITPTIVKTRSRIVNVVPIADGLRPNRRCQ